MYGCRLLHWEACYKILKRKLSLRPSPLIIKNHCIFAHAYYYTFYEIKITSIWLILPDCLRCNG